MSITSDEIYDVMNGSRSSLKIRNDIGFADMNLNPVPSIDLYPDHRSFYNPAIPEIHIGVMMIVELFEPESPEELLTAINYVRGHEEQHVRSTAQEPYRKGIIRGIEMILEYISSRVEKTKRRFRTDADYEYFANQVLPGLGIYISYDLLEEIVANLANSLEDGRIERIRSIRFPGFEKLRRIYRGKFWVKHEMDYPDYETIKDDPEQKLKIITLQILSLSTTGLYARGFAAAYVGTPMMDEVNVINPYIAKAVMAGRTRDMAAQLVEICKLLAPYIYECIRINPAAAKKALEQLLAQLIKDHIDSMPDNTGRSEKEEDTEDGLGNSPFDKTDLCVTLDDETFDKLMEKQKGKPRGGLMVRREHPLPEEENEEEEKIKAPRQNGQKQKNGEKQKGQEQDSSEGSEGTEKSEQTEQKKGSKSIKDTLEEDLEDGEEGASEGTTGSDEQEEPWLENGQCGMMGGADLDAEEGEDGMTGNAGSESEDPSDSEQEKKNSKPKKQHGSDDTESGIEGKQSRQGSRTSDETKKKGIKGENAGEGDKDSDVSEIEKAMAEAAEETNEKARQEINNINQTRTYLSKTAGKEVPSTDKPITAEDVKGICPNFEELTRKYKLTDELPPVLMARGRAMLRKNKNYFKSLSTPNVSFLDSGSVDPGRIFGLAMGDTDIFRRKGMDKKFNGCAYILIDNSGSMSGDKRIEACKAAAVIEEGFRGLIPIKIVAFDYGRKVTHEVIKGWNEQLHKNCCWNFCLHGREGGGNADAYDILIATKELLQRPEQKKLLLVLSDGMPAEATLGCTKGAIDAARKQGVQVSGIYFEEGGIGCDAADFLKMYGNGSPSRDAICCPLNELDQEVEKVMKRFSRS